MSYLTNRRRFLQATGATGVGVFVASAATAADSKSPNEKIRIACIGVGGKGREDSTDAKRNGDVVAICDVDDNTLGKVSEKTFPQAAKFNDYRKLLDEVGKNVDLVTVSIPDHMHAAVTALAMRMGKACYTQKPLTRTIFEARRLGDIARETGVATQMGNQGTSFPALRKTAATVRAGRHRQRATRTRLDQSAELGLRSAAPGPGPGAGQRALGPVAGDRAGPSLWSGLSSELVARLVGFRFGRLGRHGLPHVQHAVHGARPEESDHGAGQDRRP